MYRKYLYSGKQSAVVKDMLGNQGYLPIFHAHFWLQMGYLKAMTLFPINFTPGFMGRKHLIP